MRFLAIACFVVVLLAGCLTSPDEAGTDGCTTFVRGADGANGDGSPGANQGSATFCGTTFSYRSDGSFEASTADGHLAWANLTLSGPSSLHVAVNHAATASSPSLGSPVALGRLAAGMVWHGDKIRLCATGAVSVPFEITFSLMNGAKATLGLNVKPPSC